MYKFDEWLLIKHEKFAQRWQKLWGTDCFFLARLALYISLGFALVFSISENFFTEIHVENRASDAVLMIAILLASSGFQFVSAREKRVKKDQLSGLANVFYNDSEIRLHIGFMALLMSSILSYCIFADLRVNVIFALCGACVPIMHIFEIYFSSCSPLPPSKSKVRKLLESGFEFLRKSLTPKPRRILAPVPIPSR